MVTGMVLLGLLIGPGLLELQHLIFKGLRQGLARWSFSQTEVLWNFWLDFSVLNLFFHLGFHIDGRLDFDHHVSQICRKASKKLHALSRISKCMDINKRRMLMKALIILQFSYCPLVWMFHSRNTENRVNKIHERVLRFVYGDSPY